MKSALLCRNDVCASSRWAPGWPSCRFDNFSERKLLLLTGWGFWISALVAFDPPTPRKLLILIDAY